MRKLDWLVDACVTAHDVDRPRPSPDLVERAMRVLRIREARRTASIAASPLATLEGAAAGCAIVLGLTNCGWSAETFRSSPVAHLIPTAALLPELLDRLHHRAAARLIR